MFKAGGTIYIYLIYGIHYCLNIVTGSKGDGQAVLIRALVPLDESLKPKAYSGPGKLCKSLQLAKEHDGLELNADHGPLWIEDVGIHPMISNFVLPPVALTRVGITKATEKLWRWKLSATPVDVIKSVL